ncbi:flagellar motor protein MotB [Sphingomonas bacterium]|uniref:flagellar motor protein MotB n=1 Tax=Sphingomonas bacterium TaxID=1895847 RepID=UPI0015762B34|nr:flagellar motor protein MotB [Sphingomonas bacterium]
MAARAPHGANQPPKIVIVKKIIEGGHGGHHGGAWKVAYADFVTAMMAFFLLLWLLGATNEKQRKGIADYFTPTLVKLRENSAGSNGMFGGASLLDKDNYPHRAAQTGTKAITIPMGATGGSDVGTGTKGSIKNPTALQAEDRRAFKAMHRQVAEAMAHSRDLAQLARHVHFVQTRDGMRIDLVDDADYSMFAVGTTMLDGRAGELIGMIAAAVKGSANPIMIRGHTDSLPYGDPRAMNNWMLSTGRAEATRRRLALGGLPEPRFARIEGVADREPMIAAHPGDPRNRRVAITLLYRTPTFGS